MDSVSRKERSEALLSELGVLINPHLPEVEDEAEVDIRTEVELERRLIALWAVTGTALTESDHFREYIVRHGLENWLSRKEYIYLIDRQRPERDTVQFSWQTECLYFLGWCCGLIESIEFPREQSSIDSMNDHFPQELEDAVDLRQKFRIRSVSEILNWSDLLYRLHWAVRNAIHFSTPPPPNIDGEVVQEWHYAVNWMTRYCEEWDDVTIDT